MLFPFGLFSQLPNINKATVFITKEKKVIVSAKLFNGRLKRFSRLCVSANMPIGQVEIARGTSQNISLQFFDEIQKNPTIIIYINAKIIPRRLIFFVT